MVAQVVGIQKGIDFKVDDGKQIKGNKLHLLFNDDRVDGNAVQALFVRDEISIDHIEIGLQYQFQYDFNFKGRGRLIGIEPLK